MLCFWPNLPQKRCSARFNPVEICNYREKISFESLTKPAKYVMPIEQPHEGFEPSTPGLQEQCSATELTRPTCFINPTWTQKIRSPEKWWEVFLRRSRSHEITGESKEVKERERGQESFFFHASWQQERGIFWKREELPQEVNGE